MAGRIKFHSFEIFVSGQRQHVASASIVLSIYLYPLVSTYAGFAAVLSNPIATTISAASIEQQQPGRW